MQMDHDPRRASARSVKMLPLPAAGTLPRPTNATVPYADPVQVERLPGVAGTGDDPRAVRRVDRSETMLRAKCARTGTE